MTEIFIVPSELREKSNLKKHLSGVDYEPLPGLEANTGADVMISPTGLPFPRNDKFLQVHIDNGAKLIQLKFGHDLPGSIVDGRLSEALSRMLKVTSQRTWQCLFLYIGTIGRDDTKGMATINGQLTYGKTPMKWWYIDQAINYWMERGGIYYNLPSGKLIPEHFANTQQRLNLHMSPEDNTKVIWPKAPIFYEEIEPTNPELKKWKVAQKIVIVDDLRPLLCTIPDANIGPIKATAIFDYMRRNGYRLDWNGFLTLLRTYEGEEAYKIKYEILKVPGIGQKTFDDIKWGLFATLEERRERDRKKERKSQKKMQT